MWVCYIHKGTNPKPTEPIGFSILLVRKMQHPYLQKIYRVIASFSSKGQSFSPSTFSKHRGSKNTLGNCNFNCHLLLIGANGQGNSDVIVCQSKFLGYSFAVLGTEIYSLDIGRTTLSSWHVRHRKSIAVECPSQPIRAEGSRMLSELLERFLAFVYSTSLISDIIPASASRYSPETIRCP